MENQIEVPYHMIHGYGGGGGEGCLFPGGEAATSWCLPSVAHHHQVLQDEGYMYPCVPPPSLIPPLYRDLCTRRPAAGALQFPYDGGIINVGSPMDPAGLLAAAAGGAMGLERFSRGEGSASSSLFGTIHAELGKMTAQQIMDAKALAASKSHSEAERRRRERINGHLARLRSMLPNTTKTDKASLLAEVIQHVKELKRQTSEIAEESPLPTETDEIVVSSVCDEEGKLVMRASLCCEDRADLLPDLIKALKALRLRVLKAEITTVGGRVKSVLLIAGEQISSDDDQHQSMTGIQEALKAVVEQTARNDQSSIGGTKRQRTSSLAIEVEQKVHLA